MICYMCISSLHKTNILSIKLNYQYMYVLVFLILECKILTKMILIFKCQRNFVFGTIYNIYDFVLFFIYLLPTSNMFCVLVHYSETEFCSCLFLNLFISWSMSFLFSNFVNLILFFSSIFFTFSKYLVFTYYYSNSKHTRHFFVGTKQLNKKFDLLKIIIFLQYQSTK